MNFENVGTPIAQVINKYDKKVKPVLLCVEDDKDKVKNYFTEYNCKANEIMEVYPNPKEERQICFVSGKSGSGKSYWMQLYANKYKKLHPNRPIYLFSSLLEDTGSIDKIKGLKRVKIYEPSFLNSDFSIEDFRNMLLIFDDTDVIKDKKILSKVNSILDLCLQTGRHTNTSVLYSSHIACAGNQTKIILNESHSITLFIKGMGERSLKYVLSGYYGLDSKQITRLKKLNTRSVTIFRTYPTVVVFDKGSFVLN